MNKSRDPRIARHMLREKALKRALKLTVLRKIVQKRKIKVIK